MWYSNCKMLNWGLYLIDKYLKKSPHLGELLQRLVSSGKMLFLITNSGFEFV